MISSTAGRKWAVSICCAPLSCRSPIPWAMVALCAGIVVIATSVSVVISLGVVTEEVVLSGVVDLVLVILSVMVSACVVRGVDSVVGGWATCGVEAEMIEFVVVISAGQITPAPGLRQTVVSLPGHWASVISVPLQSTWCKLIKKSSGRLTRVICTSPAAMHIHWLSLNFQSNTSRATNMQGSLYLQYCIPTVYMQQWHHWHPRNHDKPVPIDQNYRIQFDLRSLSPLSPASHHHQCILNK